MTIPNRAKIPLGFGIALLLLVVIELILRPFTPSIDKEYRLKLRDGFFERHTGHIPDHELFWKLKPGFNGTWDGTQMSINSFGLRDREMPLKKPAGNFRILSLGESGTFGVRVPQEETYAQVLEKMLNESSVQIHFEVINAGVASYTSFQGLKYLETEGVKFEPDLVLVYFGQNDGLPTYFEDRITMTNAFGIPTYGRGMTDREIWETRHKAEGAAKLLNRSALYRNLASVVLWLEHRTKEAPSNTRRVTESERKENFLRMEKIARQNGAGIVYLVTPYFDSPVLMPPGFEPGKGRAVCDLWTKVRKRGREYNEIFSDDVHPTPFGHALIAQSIFECLSDSKLIPPMAPAVAPGLSPDLSGGKATQTSAQ